MTTTKDDIRRWLDEGKAKGATHVIVVRDTFDGGNFPVLVMPGKDAAAKTEECGNREMQRVIEVYSLSLDIEEQLNEHRAYHC